MTDYRAQPEDWATQKKWLDDCEDARCLLELRARIEALEVRDQEDSDAWTGVRRANSELRARVEALETMRETEKAAVLDLYEQHDKLKEWVGKNYMRIRALEDEPEPISEEENDRRFQACMKLIHESTPEQIRAAVAQARSLVSRVALAISGIEYGLERDEEAVNWASEARAAIREVAAWMRDNRDIHFEPSVVFALEQEAEQ